MSHRQPRVGLDTASAWMIGSALSFALMGTFVHALEHRCDWLVVAFIRAMVMLVTASSLAIASGARLAVWRPKVLWVRSLAGSVSLVCNFYALARLPVADAVTLMNLHPLWIVLISACAIRKWPALAEILGVTCGLLGVILIQRPELAGDRLAGLAGVLSSMSTAVAMLGLNRLRALDSRAVVAHFAGVASIASCVWLVLRRDSLASFHQDLTTLLLLLGVSVSGTLGQILLTKAYTAGSPSKVAVVGLTQVVFALGFDVAFWGRRLSAITLLGFLLVLAPTTWLAIRSARR